MKVDEKHEQRKLQRRLGRALGQMKPRATKTAIVCPLTYEHALRLGREAGAGYPSVIAALIAVDVASRKQAWADRGGPDLLEALRECLDVLDSYRKGKNCSACDQPVYADEDVPHLPDCGVARGYAAIAYSADPKVEGRA